MWRRKGRAARTMPRADGHPPGRAAPATPRQLAPYTPGASAGRPRIACCTAADLAWRSSSPSISPTPPWRIRQGVAPLSSGWFPVTTLGLSLTGRRSTAPYGHQQSRGPAPRRQFASRRPWPLRPAPTGRNRGEPVAWRDARRVRRAAWRNGPAVTLTRRSRPTQPIPTDVGTLQGTSADNTCRLVAVLSHGGEPRIWLRDEEATRTAPGDGRGSQPFRPAACWRNMRLAY